MFDFKITASSIRNNNFPTQLADAVGDDTMEYKLIMHHRFKLFVCVEQCSKLNRKLDNQFNTFKRSGDKNDLKPVFAMQKELNHHETLIEVHKHAVRNLIYKLGLI